MDKDNFFFPEYIKRNRNKLAQKKIVLKSGEKHEDFLSKQIIYRRSFTPS